MIREPNTKSTKLRYKEKLLDQRWQQKKSAVQIRDGFQCCKCKAKDQTVHVHHRHYIMGRDPWDYPDELLVLLCARCHKEEEDNASVAHDAVLSLHHYGFFNTDIVNVINKLIESKLSEKNGKGVVSA